MTESSQGRGSGCPFGGGGKPGATGRITLHPLADVGTAAGFGVDARTLQVLLEGIAVVERSGMSLAAEFYRTLFEAQPALRSMFPVDMASQEKKLTDMLHSVIEGLRDPAKTRAGLAELGAFHTEKGVRSEHYPPVCRALLTAMARCGGANWTSEYQGEWRRALEMISSLMLAGAKGATAPA